MGAVSEHSILVAYKMIKNDVGRINTIETEDSEVDGFIIIPSEVNPEIMLIKKQNYENLSNEAKEVIDIILNSPQEVIDVFSTPKLKMISIKMLREALITCWKSVPLVEQAIKEISQWVRKM
jgi:hypothetical protein